jgi:hypothetical protein
MKRILLLLLLTAGLTVNAQDCKYNISPTEENNGLKTTTDYLMNRCGAASIACPFFSLTNSEGVPLLNFRLLSKSKDFPPMYCLDKASKIYFQLLNGKIVTLINAYDESCSGLMYDATEKNNIRVLSSSFLFTVGSLDELEKSPIAFMRVKYSTDVVDYTIKKQLASETTKETYFPEAYFVNTLRCIK